MSGKHPRRTVLAWMEMVMVVAFLLIITLPIYAGLPRSWALAAWLFWCAGLLLMSFPRWSR